MNDSLHVVCSDKSSHRATHCIGSLESSPWLFPRAVCLLKTWGQREVRSLCPGPQLRRLHPRGWGGGSSVMHSSPGESWVTAGQLRGLLLGAPSSASVCPALKSARGKKAELALLALAAQSVSCAALGNSSPLSGLLVFPAVQWSQDRWPQGLLGAVRCCVGLSRCMGGWRTESAVGGRNGLCLPGCLERSGPPPNLPFAWPNL